MTTTQNPIQIQPKIRLAADFTMPDSNRPPALFDYGLIEALIHWAEDDKEYLERWGYAFQGTWDQDLWASLRVSPSELTEERKQEILNGVCGTSFCMAGQAVMQTGHGLFYDYIPSDDEGWKDEGAGTQASYCGPLIDTGQVNQFGRPIMRPDPDRREYISVTAKRELGITDDESEYFFSGSNTLPMLKRMANGMAWVRGLPIMFDGYCTSSPHDGTIDTRFDDDDDVDLD